MEKLLEQFIERDEATRQEAKREKAEIKAELEQQRVEQQQEIAKLRQEMAPREAISDEQFTALQTRLEALHAAHLLTDDEAFAIEDLCADFIELDSSTVGKLTVDAAQTNDTIANIRKAFVFTTKW